MTEEEWFASGDATAMTELLDSRPDCRDTDKCHAFVIHALAARIPWMADHPVVGRFLTALAAALDGRLSRGKLREARRNLDKYVEVHAATRHPYDGVSTALRLLANVGTRRGLATSITDVCWFLEAASVAKPLAPDYERVACQLLRCVFGNPFRSARFDPRWRTEAVAGLTDGICEERAFERLPILADALEEAGCDNADILAHCREPGVHVRGCWVVDLVLGKA